MCRPRSAPAWLIQRVTPKSPQEQAPQLPQTLRLRIIVEGPLPGVALAMQRGRGELVPPTSATDRAVTFELEAEVKPRPDGGFSLRGPEMQGPPASRFIYVNVGTSAGQLGSPWTRRAKISLLSITADTLVQVARLPGGVLEARFAGRDRKGEPSCATVPLVGGGWQPVAR